MDSKAPPFPTTSTTAQFTVVVVDQHWKELHWKKETQLLEFCFYTQLIEPEICIMHACMVNIQLSLIHREPKTSFSNYY